MENEELVTYLKDSFCIHLFKCFLQPNLMREKKEQPIPFTEQEVMLMEQGEMSNNEELELTDPIYDLFKHQVIGIYGM